MATRKQININWNDAKIISECANHSGLCYEDACARIGREVLKQLGIGDHRTDNTDPLAFSLASGNKVTVTIDTVNIKGIWPR